LREINMSSLLEPTPTPLADSQDVWAEAAEPTVLSPAPPPALSFDERLRSATPRTPVTWVLVAANIILFGAMAVVHGRLFNFTPQALLTWGGGLAPRVFGNQWWRAGSHMFLHGSLAHLAGNLFFLLLVAPLVERLVGPIRLVLVYVFAGLGGGLLAMGTMPQGVVVGASAAVFGVYGALLGCCLRGPRSIPWRLIVQRAGLLLLFIAVSLLCEWLDVARQPAAHLGGFVFGLVGGLMCGHKLQPRAARWRWWRLAVVTAVCIHLIILTAWLVNRCTAKARTYYRQYATAKDRERELVGRFDDAMRRWERGKITTAEWKNLLEKTLIPAWQDVRSSCGLKLTGELAELEQHNLSMQDYWSAVRSQGAKRIKHDEKPLTVEEYGKAYSLLAKVRLDTWRALADDLSGNRALLVRALIDERELEMLFAAMDDEVNADNPLFRWFEMRRPSHRPVEKEEAEPDGGFLKNRGFENGIEGWSVVTIGPPARYEFDANVKREGRQALRVTASQPTDTACGQEIMLKPGHWYRFSGWVRTRGLDPRGAPVYGTFHIHARAVNDFICKGPNHRDDTDWKQVELTFQARGDGLTRIVLFFVGFGAGTGTAWFDDLRLVEASPPHR
jgi:membrane associated rhomboid family serine protease